MDLSAYEANYQPTAVATPTPKKKLSGLPGLVANFLPTIGGAAGAVVGTVAGPVGTAAGGAAGAGLGEYLRQKITGEADDGIDKGNIVQEGIFGAIPGVAKGLKAVKTARAAEGGLDAAGGLRGVLTSGKMADEVLTAKKAAQTTEAALQNKSLLKKAGERLSGESAGIKIDKTIYGVENADKKAQNLAKFTGTPRQQITKMKAELADLGKTADDVLRNTTTKVSGADVNSRIANALTDPSVHVDLDLSTPSAQKTLANFQAKFAAANTPQEVNTVLKSAINPKAVAAEKKLAAGKNITQAENAIIAAKRAADEALSAIPELQPIKQQMAQIYELAPDVATAANKSFKIPFTGGTVGLKAPAQAVKGAQSYAGAALQKGIGVDIPVIGNSNSFVARTAKAAIPQAGYRMAGAAVGVPPTNEQPVEQPVSTEAPQVMSNPTTDMMQSASNGLPTLEQVQQYIASGGKIDDVAKYVALAEKLNPTSKDKGLNSTAAGIVTDIENGIANIRSLSSDITNNTANGPIAGRVRSLNPYDTEAQGLQANLARVKQLIGKALEGGVLRKEDEEKYSKILPTIKDTDANAVYKVNQIADDLERKLLLYRQNLGQGTGGIDVNALLAQ